MGLTETWKENPAGRGVLSYPTAGGRQKQLERLGWLGMRGSRTGSIVGLWALGPGGLCGLCASVSPPGDWAGAAMLDEVGHCPEGTVSLRQRHSMGMGTLEGITDLGSPGIAWSCEISLIKVVGGQKRCPSPWLCT